MKIVQISDPNETKRFDAYVESRAIAPTDLPGWRNVVRDAYGLRSYPLAAFDGDRVVGALTLFEARHPLFGHYLATAAFGNDGGFHFEDASAKAALQHEAMALADRLRVESLVLRGRGLEVDGLRPDRHYRTAVVDLTDGPEAVWSALPPRTRNHVRKAMKEGFSIDTGDHQMPAFFDVFSRHMRDLGSPAHSRRFYESIRDHLSQYIEFIVVRDGSVPVAAALLFRINGTAINFHTVALKAYNPRCPNYLIYWKMIEDSCQRGCRWFDMGRSEAGSATLKFKTNWRPKVITLNYHYYLRQQQEVPYLDPRNPRYRLAIAVWRRAPLVFTRALGPRLLSGIL